jgi:hypothetical protein
MLGFSDATHPTPSHKLASTMWIGLENTKTGLRGLSRSASEPRAAIVSSPRKVGDQVTSSRSVEHAALAMCLGLFDPRLFA